MCGICGYCGLDRDEPLLRRMMNVMAHRGPDDEGLHVGERVGLGMRRLSIIDLAGGAQPMTSRGGGLVLVFNGEIYNHSELRDQLRGEGHEFRTRSDTEVVLRAYEAYGRDCVRHLRGMFAFAVHDLERQELFLARDRLGIKPLFYWESGGRLLFGSELKSILECDAVPREPSAAAIDAYLSLRYVPGPGTLLRGIRKLPPAHLLIWRSGEFEVERYWEPPVTRVPVQPDAFYRERFDQLFSEAVRMRLMSDVPLGAYLSGGLDSSCIVAAMARESSTPVRTFSVGFGWKGDELAAASEVARSLGTEHREIVCRPEDVALLPDIVWSSDEPLGDAIAIPTYLLARGAVQEVKVVLTGEGADETMAGYLFHKIMAASRLYRRMPGWLHSGLVRPLVGAAPTALLDLLFDYPAYLGEAGKLKLRSYLNLARRGDVAAEYRLLIALFDERDKEALYSPALRDSLSVETKQVAAGSGEPASGDFLDGILRLQYSDWLPDNMLLRQDKLSMAHGLEARVPFLDHVLVEFLHAVPGHLKLRHLVRDKQLLRLWARANGVQGPANRRKRPFYIPLEEWAAEPVFRRLVASTLNEARVRRRGLFDPGRVRRLVEEVERREFLRVKQVLALVVLELWLTIFVDRERFSL